MSAEAPALPCCMEALQSLVNELAIAGVVMQSPLHAALDNAKKTLQAERAKLTQTAGVKAAPEGFEEQSDFIHFECPECEFDSVQRRDFDGPSACPMCAGDSGHDVRMRRRIARSTDKPEGRDARAETRP